MTRSQASENAPQCCSVLQSRKNITTKKEKPSETLTERFRELGIGTYVERL